MLTAAAAMSRRNAGADLAGHAGPAQPAISARIFGEILLMIILGEIEFRRVDDLGADGGIALGTQRLVICFLRRLGGYALGRRGGVDAGAILRTDVIALPHALGRVMAFPKSLQQ